MKIGVIIGEDNLEDYKIDGKSVVTRIVECFRLGEISKVYIIVNENNYFKYKHIKDVEFLFSERDSNAFYYFNGLFNEEDEIIVIKSNLFIFDKFIIKDFLDSTFSYNIAVMGRGKDRIYFFKGSFLSKYMKVIKDKGIEQLVNEKKHFVYNKLVMIKRVNNSYDFNRVNKEYYKYNCYKYLKKGIKIFDINNTYISEDVVIGGGVEIYPNNYLLNGSEVGDNSIILPNCFIDNSYIGKGCSIGPFSNIKGGTIINNNVVIGAFVEVKNSEICSDVKAKHHAYLGDVSVGKKTNIGCGVIVANYDGKNKHRSNIGNNTFIGSNVTIISPVKIGNNVVIGAGSTIVKDVNSDSLAIARERQINKENYYKK